MGFKTFITLLLIGELLSLVCGNCGNNSDEKNCDMYLCKDPHFFRCTNGRCISKSFTCDGEDDCGDLSDEANCKKLSSMNLSCSDAEWRCKDRLCIPKVWVCDGFPDCPDGSDETIVCNVSNGGGTFTCNNNVYVAKEWVCDGYDDCRDGSDEIDCIVANDTSAEDCTWDNAKFLCNDEKKCLDLKEVCDGTPHCLDRSDEGDFCIVPHMSCKHHQCFHRCVQLPTGPKCICHKGYRFFDDKTCQDINECDTYGICDQKCHNSPGSYSCSCDEKYTLQEDKKSCKTVGDEALLLFNSQTNVQGYFLHSKMYVSIAKKLKQALAVSFDGKHVYWADILAGHRGIVRSLMDGSQQELLILGLGSFEDLEVDLLTGNIYFTDAAERYIGVCTRDGRSCSILIKKDVKNPRAIVLNIEDGEMFWTDWGEPAKIGRALMDGSEEIAFVSTKIYWPNGLALDYPNQRLYWTDAKINNLESIKLDGTDRRIIMEGVLQHPYSLDVFENNVYWSDWDTRSIQTCDKFTGKHNRTIFRLSKGTIYGIHIFHPALRGKRENPCAFALCSDFCLLRGSGYKCACPQHKKLSVDLHTCNSLTTTSVTCPPASFTCNNGISNRSICVPQTARCNGTFECPLQDDELGCDCGADEFKCANKKCIRYQWICNKVDDCGDNSDELEALCQMPEVPRFSLCVIVLVATLVLLGVIFGCFLCYYFIRRKNKAKVDISGGLWNRNYDLQKNQNLVLQPSNQEFGISLKSINDLEASDCST